MPPPRRFLRDYFFDPGGIDVSLPVISGFSAGCPANGFAGAEVGAGAGLAGLADGVAGRLCVLGAVGSAPSPGTAPLESPSTIAACANSGGCALS